MSGTVLETGDSHLVHMRNYAYFVVEELQEPVCDTVGWVNLRASVVD